MIREVIELGKVIQWAILTLGPGADIKFTEVIELDSIDFRQVLL